ncbi:hypothetical protein ACUHMQ_09955 [Chitinimonas sp. PSY-7]|uniref:hypothetical protein n=1 Tax=Chitinimonas sp. PSY-7 TaxID=3459088 RepID=UPI00403FDA20
MKKLTKLLAERRKLRKPTAFHIAVADRIAQLNLSEWASLTASDSYFLSADYLAMLEKVGPANLEPKYALISDDEGPVAAVSMQVVKVTALHNCGKPMRPRRYGDWARFIKVNTNWNVR